MTAGSPGRTVWRDCDTDQRRRVGISPKPRPSASVHPTLEFLPRKMEIKYSFTWECLLRGSGELSVRRFPTVSVKKPPRPHDSRAHVPRLRRTLPRAQGGTFCRFLPAPKIKGGILNLTERKLHKRQGLGLIYGYFLPNGYRPHVHLFLNQTQTSPQGSGRAPTHTHGSSGLHGSAGSWSPRH